MRCPACKSPLMVVEWRQIELDHCPACRGTWFDAGELDLLLAGIDLTAEAGLRQLLTRPETPTDEKRVRCPRCSRKMKKVRFRDAEDGITVDLCDQGDGIWFDRGEVTALAAALGRSDSTAAAHVGEYLGDLFR
jgi:Zn-finger nucleic acid-binding protein